MKHTSSRFNEAYASLKTEIFSVPELTIDQKKAIDQAFRNAYAVVVDDTLHVLSVLGQLR